jgi:hypothetical protein
MVLRFTNLTNCLLAKHESATLQNPLLDFIPNNPHYILSTLFLNTPLISTAVFK